MKKIINKLKSQKGATGTDVLVAATMIVLSIVVVSMLYVNTSLQSRNITRTAGATRIATNIIENINAHSYDEFLTTFYSYIDDALEETTSSVELIGNGDSFFETKIPTGYTVVLRAEPVYGSITDPSKQFDLVRQVKVTVKYNVGKVVEQVEFSTVKQRELIQECNAPDVNELRSTGTLKNGMNYYPVKYVQNARAYVKTIESDPEWYNYQNKNWAMIIVSKVDESNLFDVNGKFIGTIETDTSSNQYTEKMVWVPRFFANQNQTNKRVQFTFKASSDQIILKSELTAKDVNSKFNYYTFSNVDSTIWSVDSATSLFTLKTGNWVNIESISSDAAASILNSSQYGPCIIRD